MNDPYEESLDTDGDGDISQEELTSADPQKSEARLRIAGEYNARARFWFRLSKIFAGVGIVSAGVGVGQSIITDSTAALPAGVAALSGAGWLITRALAVKNATGEGLAEQNPANNHREP